MSELLTIITSDDPNVRDRSLDSVCRGVDRNTLLEHCRQLDEFRRTSENLYHRVRALFFLYAIHRFHLPQQLTDRQTGHIPFVGYEHLLNRRFHEAIDCFLKAQNASGPTVSLSSALAESCHRLAFQTLADQVRRSVRTVRGNQWMFRTGHWADIPLRVRRELTTINSETGCFPALRERTSVRMDFTHSAWSDIFFLGMDFPEGARVINASVDLAVRGRHQSPQPPIECCLRVIDEPVLRLVSIDLDAHADIHDVNEVFDFGRDYLGLLKAAVIASGVIPPGMEGSGARIADVFGRMIGSGLGLELVSRVNDIPKGSRLAVSTNLLGALITVCMRATNQITQLTGGLTEPDRRLVAARAILGEWLGGSGGGWQDSGGIWPGIKLIEGALAGKEDPEYGISRGRLMPQHRILDERQASQQARERLQQSLVLVHGGMAQNVGPILEMVTEKYLLRSETEWRARQQAISLLDNVLKALHAGDIHAVGRATDQNFHGPLQKIIPWCSNAYTERLIELCRERYGTQFYGFWMLGGMAGGGMGFIFSPDVRAEAADWLAAMMPEVKASMEDAVPFAMEPVVYDFAINDRGTWAELSHAAEMPAGYAALMIPELLRQNKTTLPAMKRRELERAGDACRSGASDLATQLIGRILPSTDQSQQTEGSLQELLQRYGFNPAVHAQLKDDLRSGRVGLAQNRLPASATITDVHADDVIDVRHAGDPAAEAAGRAALADGAVAVVTLAAGAGSRWTQGAGVVKALNPFCRIDGRFRSFLDVHLAKSRRTRSVYACLLPHVVTTGYLTDGPIRRALRENALLSDVWVSPAATVGLRLVPMVRDLQFAWEETAQQVLDEQQEKVRSSVRAALIEWARAAGEAADYTDNAPVQCLHPVGHWYEVPGMLLNGTLQRLLKKHPQLQYLMLHNIDTLGASVDPAVLGRHILAGADLSFEVIGRRLEDRGGGLARVNGRPRLVEGLAMPREEDEFCLSWYNSMTTWITIDRLLNVFGLNRSDLDDRAAVADAVSACAARLPTYITLKDVKKRWGRGQEDVFPVCQFEKLWGDMTALADVNCSFLAVSTLRGQQLKDPAQLDAWLRDGSADYVRSLVEWADTDQSA